MFLSTEDRTIIEKFSNLSSPLRIMYTNVSRYSPSDKLSPMKFAQKVGRSTEIMNNFLNLVLAAQCDGFVGQLASNWVVLINDYRSSFTCKARRPFLQVQPKSESKLTGLLMASKSGKPIALTDADPHVFQHGR